MVITEDMQRATAVSHERTESARTAERARPIVYVTAGNTVKLRRDLMIGTTVGNERGDSNGKNKRNG